MTTEILYFTLLAIGVSQVVLLDPGQAQNAKPSNPSSTLGITTLDSQELPSWYPSHRQMIGEGNFRDGELTSKKQQLILQKANAGLDVAQENKDGERKPMSEKNLRIHQTQASILKDPPLKQHHTQYHYPPNFVGRRFRQSFLGKTTKYNDYRNQLLDGYSKAKLGHSPQDRLEISSEDRQSLRNNLRQKLRQLSKEEIKVEKLGEKSGTNRALLFSKNRGLDTKESVKLENLRADEAVKEGNEKLGMKYTPLNVIAKLMPLTLASQANRDLAGPTKAEAIFRKSISKTRPSFGPGAPTRHKLGRPNIQFKHQPKRTFGLSPSFDSVPTEEEGLSSHEGEDSESGYQHYEPTADSPPGDPHKERILSAGQDREYTSSEDDSEDRSSRNYGDSQPRNYAGRDRPTNFNWGSEGSNYGPQAPTEEGPFHKKSPAMIYDSDNGYGHDADGLVDSYENVMLEKDLGFGGYCGDKENGLYADQTTKCQQFYACEWGRSHQFTCPYGTAYNNVNYKCDWNYNVEC